MSSDAIKEKKEPEISITSKKKGVFRYILSEMTVAFSEVISKKKSSDIYSGEEKVPFKQRHPIFKAMMRIEFEKAMKTFLRKESKKK